MMVLLLLVEVMRRGCTVLALPLALALILALVVVHGVGVQPLPSDWDSTHPTRALLSPR